MLLDLLGRRYELIDVPYGDRNQLATLTGGYIYVPVLVDDAGKVIVESRAICQLLLGETSALTPAPLEGPIWAYHDFCDGPLEDVLFRISSPYVRDAWPTPGERALYVLIKERKFGAGCVDQWRRDQPLLLAKARQLLAPTVKTLHQTPFLFGDRPTLADAALYGCCIMLEDADPSLITKIDAQLVAYLRRLEAKARS